MISSVAARLARLDRDINDADKAKVVAASGGYGLKDLSRRLVDALHGDFSAPASDSPPSPAGEGSELRAALIEAAKPLSDPALRELLLRLRQQADMVIDTVTPDHLIEAGFSAAATDRARSMVETFESFIAKHRDEITALQILYNRPTRAPLTFEAIRQLADSLQATAVSA
ncbi:type I site-specific deoxyribonuclease, partial [mine drainage metagenome]